MARNAKTSKAVARKASRLLRTSRSRTVRAVAASALGQANRRKKKK